MLVCLFIYLFTWSFLSFKEVDMPGGEDDLGKSSELEGTLPAILCGFICQCGANLCTKLPGPGSMVWVWRQKGGGECQKGILAQS